MCLRTFFRLNFPDFISFSSLFYVSSFIFDLAGSNFRFSSRHGALHSAHCNTIYSPWFDNEFSLDARKKINFNSFISCWKCWVKCVVCTHDCLCTLYCNIVLRLRGFYIFLFRMIFFYFYVCCFLNCKSSLGDVSVCLCTVHWNWIGIASV